MSTIAQYFLYFSHEELLIPIILLGFLCWKRDVFGHAVYLLLFGMIFNTVLKYIFQIPLPAKLGIPGFAFPSGHMLSAMLFYGWVAYKIPQRWVRYGALFILAGIFWGLQHYEYHNAYEVITSVMIGTLFILLYDIAQDHLKMDARNLGFALLLGASILVALLAHCWILKPHVLLAYYALAGLSLAWRRLLPKEDTIRTKLISTIIVLTLVGVCYMGMRLPMIKTLPIYLSQLPWLLIGLSIPLSVYLARLGTKKAPR